MILLKLVWRVFKNLHRQVFEVVKLVFCKYIVIDFVQLKKLKYIHKPAQNVITISYTSQDFVIITIVRPPTEL